MEYQERYVFSRAVVVWVKWILTVALLGMAVFAASEAPAVAVVLFAMPWLIAAALVWPILEAVHAILTQAEDSRRQLAEQAKQTALLARLADQLAPKDPNAEKWGPTKLGAG